MQPENVPDSTEVLEALKRAIRDNPGVRRLPAEEVARQLLLGGYLPEEPPLPFVADALGTMEAEDQAFGPDVPIEDE
jgi:hypothetical protein